MASAKKISSKKSKSKPKGAPNPIAEIKERLKNQQEALKKIVKSLSKNKPEEKV